ncbi:MAG: DUF4129 domain-containing protein, partial [Chloroflexi bacterium]|nr:DUF4129 domain-containing protein [Chloroflexota bacterium]
AFIGLAALVAFLLPTGYTFVLLAVAGLAIILIASVLGAISWLLVALFVLPMICVLTRFAKQEESTPQIQSPPVISLPPLQENGAASTNEWFVILRMVIFWAVVLGVLFFLLRRYLRDRPELQRALVGLRPVRALRWGWATLWRWLKKWSARLGQSVGERLPRRLSRRLRRAAPGVTIPRFLRLGGLPPREQVMQYYANILRRAREQGLGRGRGQTPYEYQATLEAGLSQAREEIEGLTQAFVEARYSPREVEAEVVTGVRAYWARIKRALRRRGREREADG